MINSCELTNPLDQSYSNFFYDMLEPLHPRYWIPFGNISGDTVKVSMFIFGAVGLACSCFQSVRSFKPIKNVKDFFDNFSRAILEIMMGGFIGFYWPITVPAWLGYRFLTNPPSSNE
jgi:hypothetical protein